MSGMLNVIFDFEIEVPLLYYCHKTGNLYTFPRHTIDIFGNIKNAKGEYVSAKSNDYLSVDVTDDTGNPRPMLIHRAMCSSFYGKPPNGYTADHIDIDKKSNILWNLRWASSRSQGLNRNERKTNVDCCPIIGTHVKTGEVIAFVSIKDARNNGFTHVTDCLYGKKQTDKKYRWSCPPELPDIKGEIWKLWRTGRHNVWVSDKNRVMFEFGHGYKKKMSSNELTLNNGYHQIYCEGIHSFHRVVWSVFNGDIPEDTIVHHKDHDKANNSLDNLELTNNSGNTSAAHDAGRYDGTKSQRQPIVIDGIEYTSCFDAARKLNPQFIDRDDILRMAKIYRVRGKSSNFSSYSFA